MKKSINYIFVIFCSTLFACQKEYSADITIKNEVSNVTLDQIYFGKKHSSYESLLPGQETKISMYGYDGDWPMLGSLSFVMSASDNQVYLTTDSSYVIDKEQHLTIVINDDTPVSSY